MNINNRLKALEQKNASEMSDIEWKKSIAEVEKIVQEYMKMKEHNAPKTEERKQREHEWSIQFGDFVESHTHEEIEKFLEKNPFPKE